MVFIPKKQTFSAPLETLRGVRPLWETGEGDRRVSGGEGGSPSEVVSQRGLTPKQKGFERGMWSSIALRFGGFDANLKAMIAPLNENLSPIIAKLFFQNKLPSVIEFARRNPAHAMSVMGSSTNADVPYWNLLLQTACGNSAATIKLLDLIDHQKLPHSTHKNFADSLLEVSKFSADDASRLLRHLFAVADTKTRLSIYEMFIDNERLGSHRVLGDMFVQLMARATPDEREAELYPSLKKILSSRPNPSSRSGFVAALFRGWLSEA